MREAGSSEVEERKKNGIGGRRIQVRINVQTPPQNSCHVWGTEVRN